MIIDIKLESITKNIVGTWYNPITKTTYRFNPFSNRGSSKIYLKQYGKKTCMELTYRIVMEENLIWLELGGRKFKLSKFVFEPEPFLSFITSSNKVIVLFKAYSRDF